MFASEAPGWYGKVASLGDFASRRCTPDWVRVCDEWLSRCVADSRQRLGDDWLTAYLSAPLWRFAWGPGVMGTHWWFGVLMPSCDNVGRYFPLIVAQPRVDAPADRSALDHLDAWWSHVAGASLSTLSEGASIEAFEDALHRAPIWPGTASTAWRPLTPGAPADGIWRHSMQAEASLGDIVRALAAGSLQQRMSGATFWWPVAPAGVASSCTILDGLPTPDEFARMLRSAQ